MVDMAQFSMLRLPKHVAVPDGALNSTGVQADHNELILRSCKTETFASQMEILHEEAATVELGPDAAEFTYLPARTYAASSYTTYLLTPRPQPTPAYLIRGSLCSTPPLVPSFALF